jgi:beta-xylosidase
MSIKKTIEIDVRGKKRDFQHFFRATGYANADYTYTPAVERMYDYLSSYAGHPKYMRLHNIMTLHGKGDYYKFECGSDYGNPLPPERTDVDIVVQKNPEGGFSYDWTYVDKVYDTIINHDMVPIVEMVYMPSVLRKDDWECIPVNYKEYYEVVRQFVLHWTERYGKSCVRTWYFEIINEPDGYGILNENPGYFMALYDYFEAAVHSVDSKYQAGGPAVKQWEDGKRLFELFIQHCEHGVNHVSGLYGTRLDFISVHCKAGFPTMVGPQLEYMFNPLREFAEILRKYPTFNNTPFFNDESDIVWDGNQGVWYKSWLNFRNKEYAPGFICKMVNHYCDVIQDELGLNLAIVDSDNSHLPWERYLFSGNRSQLTPLGVAPCTDLLRKGFFNAGHLLGRLGTQRFLLKSKDSEFGDKFGALATELENKKGYSIMLWNFEDGLDNNVNHRTVQLLIDGLDGDYRAFTYRIDRNYSNPHGVWEKMGKPFPLLQNEIEELRKADYLALDETNLEVSGNFNHSFEMPMHSVVLLLIVKEDEPEEIIFKKVIPEKGVLGTNQVFLAWTYSKRFDFMGYNIYRGEEKLNDTLLTSACFTDSKIELGKKFSYSIEAVYAYGNKKFKEIEVDFYKSWLISKSCGQA